MNPAPALMFTSASSTMIAAPIRLDPTFRVNGAPVAQGGYPWPREPPGRLYTVSHLRPRAAPGAVRYLPIIPSLIALNSVPSFHSGQAVE